MSLLHFLLIYDLRQRRLVDVQTFTDATEATDAYGRAELEHLNDRDTEIVLVGADSIETIKRTHGHYFTEGKGPIALPVLAAS
ncbi:MAG: hypothetical protein ACYC9W_04310 [Candidatus Limnocylindria bacterium]